VAALSIQSFSSEENDQRRLLAEYEACVQMRNRDASLIWQIGAIMMGGAVVAESISFQLGQNCFRMLVLDLLAAVAIITWIWCSRRSHDFLRLSEERARQIERRLSDMQLFQLRAQFFTNRRLDIDSTHLEVAKPRHFYRLEITGVAFIVLIIIKAMLVFLGLI